MVVLVAVLCAMLVRGTVRATGTCAAPAPLISSAKLACAHAANSALALDETALESTARADGCRLYAGARRLRGAFPRKAGGVPAVAVIATETASGVPREGARESPEPQEVAGAAVSPTQRSVPVLADSRPALGALATVGLRLRRFARLLSAGSAVCIDGKRTCTLGPHPLARPRARFSERAELALVGKGSSITAVVLVHMVMPRRPRDCAVNVRGA